MLKLASEGMILPYQVVSEHGFTITNIFGANTKEGYLLAYVDGYVSKTPDGTRFTLNTMKPERIYCNFKLINPKTGDEVK